MSNAVQRETEREQQPHPLVLRMRALYSHEGRETCPGPRSMPTDPAELVNWRLAQLEAQLAAVRADVSRTWWTVVGAIVIAVALRLLGVG